MIWILALYWPFEGQADQVQASDSTNVNVVIAIVSNRQTATDRQSSHNAHAWITGIYIKFMSSSVFSRLYKIYKPFFSAQGCILYTNTAEQNVSLPHIWIIQMTLSKREVTREECPSSSKSSMRDVIREMAWEDKATARTPKPECLKYNKPVTVHSFLPVLSWLKRSHEKIIFGWPALQER